MSIFFNIIFGYFINLFAYVKGKWGTVIHYGEEIDNDIIRLFLSVIFFWGFKDEYVTCVYL